MANDSGYVAPGLVLETVAEHIAEHLGRLEPGDKLKCPTTEGGWIVFSWMVGCAVLEDREVPEA